jgi:hypothetical protein
MITGHGSIEGLVRRSQQIGGDRDLGGLIARKRLAGGRIGGTMGSPSSTGSRTER